MKNEAITGSLIILSIIWMLVFWKALYEQEKSYIKYENQVHKEFCELAEAREANLEYLMYNWCK